MCSAAAKQTLKLSYFSPINSKGLPSSTSLTTICLKLILYRCLAICSVFAMLTPFLLQYVNLFQDLTFGMYLIFSLLYPIPFAA